MERILLATIVLCGISLLARSVPATCVGPLLPAGQGRCDVQGIVTIGDIPLNSISDSALLLCALTMASKTIERRMWELANERKQRRT